jgi:integrase
MPSRFQFTKKDINNLPLPATGKRDWHWDKGVRGLALQVTSTGNKCFYLVRKVRSSPTSAAVTEKIRIGVYPDKTIDAARREAEKLNTQIANGANPAQTKRESRVEQDKITTFGQLFEQYIELYAKKNTKRWEDTEANYRRYFRKAWHRKPIQSITHNDVQKWVDDLAGDDGEHKHTANRNFDTFRAVYNWGLKRRLFTVQDNPCFGIERFKVKARERFILPGDEYERVMQAIHDEPNTTLRDFFLICLYTGMRKSNVLAMKWQDIKWDVNTWMIPSDETKNDDPYAVSLTTAAMALLQTRWDNRKKLNRGCGKQDIDKWVFPSDGVTGHLVSPKTAWKRILERAEVQDLRIHDLRRTVGSYMDAEHLTCHHRQDVGPPFTHLHCNLCANESRSRSSGIGSNNEFWKSKEG